MRLLVAALVAAAALSVQSADATAALPLPVTCASSSLSPHAVTSTSARSATLCLINVERQQRGLRPLRHNPRLALAAVRHARDMVRHGYFAHDSRDGRDFVTRVIRAGYVRSRSGDWVVGENIGWGGGTTASPRAIVASWMRSPGHRRNILSPAYREIGIGLVRRAPVRGQQRAATYVTEFGAR